MLFMPQNKSEREEGFFTVKIKTRNNLIRLQFVSLACPSLKRARIASRYDVHTPKKYILNLSQSISVLWRYIYGTKASAERRIIFHK